MKQKLPRQAHLLCCIFLLLVNFAAAQYIFRNDSLPGSISLHPYTTIANTGQHAFNIDTIIRGFDALHPSKLNTANDDLGFTKDHFWARVRLDNPTSQTLNYYLETARPVTDLVELYSVDATGRISKSATGDHMPFSTRSFNDRRSIFKITLPPNSKTTLYLHLKSDGEVVKMPMMLRNSETYIAMVSLEEWVFGIFYGILLTAAIIYFFFFLGLRDQTFLYYALYVVFIGLLQFALDGYFFKLILPGGGWFAEHAVLIFAMIAGVLLGRYSEVFLDIKTYSKNIALLFKALYCMALVILLLIFFVPPAFAMCYPLANVVGLMILMLIIGSVIYLHYKKVAVDRFFSIGILFLILGFGIFILNNFGQVPNSFFTLNSSKFGTGLEIIFLSLSMANLIRNLKNEKNELYRLALVRSEEMNELKSYFLSNISHELRTPLNAIMNMADSIAKTTTDDKIVKDSQIIKYSSHSLLSSVNDILDFSKIEKGELRLEAVEFEPVKTLEHLRNNAMIRAKDQGLEFEYSKAPGIPDLCLGDVTRLVQIVNNVLSNAIKFTPAGKVSFELSSIKTTNNRSRLCITISDTGIGIAKEKLARIFESFTQDQIDNKRKFGGLGLGLYIVKTLVDMQNGSITIASEPQKGTTCRIEIEYEVVKQTLVPELVADTVYDLKGKHLLVVEDNAINQMVIKMIAKKWLNTTVSYANNGQEGLDLMLNEHFDLILMDLQMPVMDGYEATIAIRNGEAGPQNCRIPIIAVTADVMEATKLRVKEIGMNHYLSKPLKGETLYAAVHGLLFGHA